MKEYQVIKKELVPSEYELQTHVKDEKALISLPVVCMFGALFNSSHITCLTKKPKKKTWLPPHTEIFSEDTERFHVMNNKVFWFKQFI